MPPENHKLPIAPPAAVQSTSSPNAKWPCPQCTFPRCIRPDCTGLHCHNPRHDRVADKWRAEEWPKRFKNPNGWGAPAVDEKALLVGRCTVCRPPLRCVVQGCRVLYHCHKPQHESSQPMNGAMWDTLTVASCVVCPRPPRCIGQDCFASFHCHDLSHPFENVSSPWSPPRPPRRTGDQDMRRFAFGDAETSGRAQISQREYKPVFIVDRSSSDMFPPATAPAAVASSSYQIDERGACTHASYDAHGSLSFWP